MEPTKAELLAQTVIQWPPADLVENGSIADKPQLIDNRAFSTLSLDILLLCAYVVILSGPLCAPSGTVP